MISFTENENKNADDGVVVDNEAKINIYLIDFAHAIPNPGNRDMNCLDSLKYLIYLFENFVEIHTKSLTGTISLPLLILQSDAEKEKNRS